MRILGIREAEHMLRGELKKERPDRQKVLLYLTLLREEGSYPASVQLPVQAKNAWIRFQKKEDLFVKKARRPWLRVAAVAAVLSLVIFAAPPVFGAGSLSELLGRWTERVFTFESTPQTTAETVEDSSFETTHPGLRQIHKTAVNLGINQPVVPTWVPDGYELQEIKTSTVNEGTSIHALLSDGTENINISILVRNTRVAAWYEKDETEAHWIEISGIAHYVLSNNEWNTIAWLTGNVECCIAVSDKNIDYMKMLRSIYEGEEQ